MKKIQIILTLLFMLLHASFATAATDGFYQLSEVTASWDGTDASRTKAPTADYDYSYGDESSVTYTLPWAFTFYGQSYSSVTADTNGNVWFSATGSAHSFDLATTGRGPVIVAWNSDLSSYFYGGVFIQHKTNPERVVIEWQTETYRDESYGRHNNFEIVIFANGAIRSDYRTFDAPTATDSGSGISKGDGSASLSLTTNYGNAYSLAGRSFLFAGGQKIYLPKLTENLDDTIIGGTSQPHVIPVYNVGTDNLLISGVSLATGSAFSLVAGSDTCSGATLAPGQMCTVQAVFAPNTLGAQNSTLTISSSDPGTPTSDVTLSGTGLYPTLTVTKSDIGAGSVASSPAGISCGTTCTSQFTTGSSVTLTATPDSGSIFTGWSGACSGTGDCTVTMDATKNVTASFTPITNPIVTITSPTGQITGNRPVLQYSAGAGSVVVSVDGVVVNKISGDLLDALANGSHLIRVEATNAAGYTGFAESTVIVDTLPLAFNSTPAAGGQNVAVDAAIVLSFNEALDTASFTQNSITLASPFGNVPGTIKISTDAKTLTFKPSVQLGYNRVHTVTLKAGLRDLRGYFTPSDSSFTFTTQAASADLVGLWHMDGDWSDASGKGNNLTMLNGVVLSSDFIGGNSAGTFNGVKSYLRNSTGAGLPVGSSPRTYMAWIKPFGYPDSNYNGIIAYGTTVCNQGSLLSIKNDGRLSMAFWCNDSYQTVGNPVTLNQWSHVAFTYDGGTKVRFYINGQFIQENTLSSVPNTQNGPIRIGSTDDPGRVFNGLIDEVAIYKRALTLEEIQSKYNARPTLAITSPGQMVKYKPGDVGTATISVANSTGIASLACTASGAASESFTLDFDTPQTNITHEFNFQVAPNALSSSSITINCTSTDSGKNIGKGSLSLALSDSEAPVVVGASISDNATGVLLTTPIKVDFSEALLPETVNAASVTLTDISVGNQAASGKVVLSVDRKSISFLPGLSLSADTTYRFTISTLVTDETGNHLPQDFSIQFSTQSVSPLNISNMGTSASPHIVNGGGFSTITIDNSYVIFYGPVAASSISLSNNSTISHYGATTTDEFSLDLIAETISIDSTSKIDVSSKGYLGGRRNGNNTDTGRTLGNTNTGGSTIYNGGSYGGPGGVSTSNGTVNASYGTPQQPGEVGSGGGGSVNGYGTALYGGNGGGLVKLTATALTLSGGIFADGGSGTTTGGGSGGGIYLKVGTLSGTGTIAARGGAVTDSTSYGAGGGGRIAVYYNSLQLPVANILVNGGSSSTGTRAASNGGAGTIYLKDNAKTTADLFIINGGSATSNTTIVPSDNYENMTIKSNAQASVSNTLSLTGNFVLDKSTFVAQYPLKIDGALTASTQSVLTHYGATTTAQYNLDVTAASVSIDSSSKIDVSGKGYMGGDKAPAAAWTLGNTTTGGSRSGSGGSYGGVGGRSSDANATYGDLSNPNELGSGGSSGNIYYFGNSGGGLIRIKALSITVDGSVLADGVASVEGAGSGGGIFIDANTISGSGIGIIAARGGSGGNAGGGGGGRVAIYYETLTFPRANLYASGGNGYQNTTNLNGGAGTIYLKQKSKAKPELILNNNGIVTSNATTVPGGDYINVTVKGRAVVAMGGNFTAEQDMTLTDMQLTVNGTLSLPGNLSLTNSTLNVSGGITVPGNLSMDKSTLVLKDNLTVNGAINLTNQSVLSHYGATTSEFWKLNIQASTVSVDSTSKIDVSGKGYLGGMQNGNGSIGRTLGNLTTGGSTSRNSGSYGGRAGVSTYGGTVNAIYGVESNPNELGSGGGSDSYTSAGNGGGLVRLQADMLTLNGSILADGMAGGHYYYYNMDSHYYGGSGSGGGIWLNVGTLNGTGSINARGGASVYTANIAGAGGGRIAIYYNSMNLPTANINAAGGKSMDGSNSVRNGGVGSVYLFQNVNSLAVSKTGTGTGTVISTPGGITCGSTCGGNFGKNSSVILTVTADVGSVFTGWSGACSGISACTLTMDTAKTVSATFEALPPLELLTASLPDGTINIAYNRTINVTGGVPPYTFSLINSSVLPTGLTLNGSTGIISGTPTRVESSTATIQVIDANGMTVSKDLTLNINGTLIISSDKISCTSGISCTQQLEATGGRFPYSWSITSNNLPSGLTLNNGIITGNSAEVVNVSLTVEVTDSNGSKTSKALQFTNYLSVTEYKPANEANVSNNITIQASFSAPLNLATINTDNFTLSNKWVPKAIAAGNTHSLALKNDGTIGAWGDNSYGQTTVPVELSGITAIAAGYHHNLALKSDGSIAVWGDNSLQDVVPPSGLTGVTAIAAGTGHYLAINSNGEVVAWGNNWSGEATVPSGLTEVTSIAAGPGFSLALKSDGEVVAWGDNSYGQTTVPSGLSEVTAIAAGNSHCLALKSDGTVVAWGDDSSGQATVPSGLTGVTAIAAGAAHSLALKNDGTVVGWGYDWIGQATVPSDLSGVKSIAAGGAHSLALKNDGTVVAWGGDWLGQSSVPAGLSASGNVVNGTLDYNGTTHTATFTPSSLLLDGSVYYASLAGVTSDTGVPLSAPFSWSFRTYDKLYITTSDLLEGITGSAYSQSLKSIGGAEPYNWSIINGALPPGLNLDSATGMISGVPTGESSSLFTIQVRDSVGTVVSKDFTMFTAPPLIITTTGMLNTSVGGQVHQKLNATGGVPPYTWSIAAGELPPGLNLSNFSDPFDSPCQSINGYVTGATGQYTFTLQVTDSTNMPQKASITFRVNVFEPINVTTRALTAIANSSYTNSLQATGGVAPYTWSADSQSLPPGLSIASNGMISGIPTSGGEYWFVVQIEDSVGLRMAEWLYMIVNQPISIRTTNLPYGVIGLPYTNRTDRDNPDIYLQSDGGTGCDWDWCNPRNIWSIVAGTLPNGIILDQASGKISGIPSESGNFDITFKVIDPGSNSQATMQLHLEIKPVEILDKGLSAGTLHKPYADTLTAAGTSPFTWSASNLPPGIILDPNTGALSGTPTSIGYYKVAIQVVDADQATEVKELELSVNDLDLQWMQAITGDGTRGIRVITDADNNIYALGTTYNATNSNQDIILTKYSATGVQIWSNSIDNGADSAVDMVIDGSNNLYVLNNYYDFTSGISDHKIIKYAADGSYLWSSTSGLGIPAKAIAIDSQGNSFIIAEYYNNGNNDDVKVYKYDGNGARVETWESTYDHGSNEYPRAIAVDNSGNIYVSAQLSTTEGGSFLTLKFNSDGENIWAQAHKTQDDDSVGIAVDSNNGVYVAGNSYSNDAGKVKTIKYDTNGNLLWANIYGRVIKEDSSEGSISLDGKGNLYVVGGSYYRTVDKQEYLIVKYDANSIDPNGNILWTKSNSSLGIDKERANGVAIDKDGNLICTGQAYDPNVGTDKMLTVKFYRTDLSITTTVLPEGVVGSYYSQQLESRYGLAPYTWSIINGTLPAGLTLNADTGVISGTPLSAGSSSVTIQVQDSKGVTANGTYMTTITLW
jgi:alpha-tubulin suppressor-like RCC1 family protein